MNGAANCGSGTHIDGCCSMHISAVRAETGLSLQVAPSSTVRDNTDVHTHRGDRRFGIIAALAEMPMKPSVAAN